MEINRPDLGIFKGMCVQPNGNTHKRNYPSVDNRHQFDHEHPNPNQQFQTMSRLEFQKPEYVTYNKATRNSNRSNIVLGDDKASASISVTKQNFKHHGDYRRLSELKRKQQRLILGQDAPIYKSTTHDRHDVRPIDPTQQIVYKVEKEKIDPILGTRKTEDQIKATNNFEFYNHLKNKNYVANNFTRIPQKGQKFDIITGRKLPF